MIPDIRLPTVVALVVGVAAFVGGYTTSDWRWEAKTNAEALKRSQDASKARDEATAAYIHLAGELAAKNDQHAHELRVAQDETNRLRARVNDGAIGLRYAGLAACPATPAAPGARVDTGAGAELDTTARRAYFALREGIDRASAQLAACQDELRARAADLSLVPRTSRASE